MSNDRNAGPSPIRARTRSAYCSGVHVRSSSQVTISKPHPRGSSRSEAAYSEPRMPASSDAVRVDQPLLERALERRAVEVALAVVLLPGVGVGVEQHDADRPVDRRVRAQLAEHDRVVAAERRAGDAGAQHRRRAAPRSAPWSLGVARCDVQVAEVDDRERLEDVDVAVAGATAVAAARRRGSRRGRSARRAASSSRCRTGRRSQRRRPARGHRARAAKRANVRMPV